MIGALAAFGEDGWSSANDLTRIFVMIAAFGFATLPFTYFLARFFSVPTAGLTVLTIFYILNGLVLSLIVRALNKFEFNYTADLLTNLFMVLPHFAMNRILVNLQYVVQREDICTIHCNNIEICNKENKCELLSLCCG